MMNYLTSFAISFLTVFLKGFQFKNIIGNHYISMAIVSYIIGASDVLLIGLVVNKGWTLLFSTGAGASIGLISSVWVHNKFFKKK